LVVSTRNKTTDTLAVGEGWEVQEGKLPDGDAYRIRVLDNGLVIVMVSNKAKMTITETYKLAAKFAEIAKGFQSAGLAAQARLDDPKENKKTDH